MHIEWALKCLRVEWDSDGRLNILGANEPRFRASLTEATIPIAIVLSFRFEPDEAGQAVEAGLNFGVINPDRGLSADGHLTLQWQPGTSTDNDELFPIDLDVALTTSGQYDIFVWFDHDAGHAIKIPCLVMLE